ncbi:MAG: DUF3343 domain-containing protein [Chloroflexia bacterium]
MGEASFAVVLVPSVSHALRAESLVRTAGIPCKLIPTPRQLSSDCGTALRVPEGERERVEAVLREAGLEYEGVYSL